MAEWNPLKVVIKATGEMQTIKDIYFNEELHEKVDVVAPSVEPSIEALNPEVWADPVAPDAMSAVKPLTEMKMHEVRAAAKEKGILTTPSMKKQEIIDLISNGV
jgi:hypothetical protein